jgi:copper chaperone CopZ
MKKRVTLMIEGMECPNCALKLEGIEDRLEGVLRAEASYHKGQMVVEYNDAQVTIAEMKTEVSRLGYQVKTFST